MQGMQVWFLDRKDSLEKGVTTHCSILAGENPMDRGASWAIVHGGLNCVRHVLATKQQQNFILIYGGLLRWLSGKESACPCRRHRVGLIPGLGRPLKGGNDNPLQYSCLGNSMGRGAWRDTVHGSPRVRHDWATEHTRPLIYISHLLYPFIHRWMLRLFPSLAYSE